MSDNTKKLHDLRLRDAAVAAGFNLGKLAQMPYTEMLEGLVITLAQEKHDIMQEYLHGAHVAMMPAPIVVKMSDDSLEALRRGEDVTLPPAAEVHIEHSVVFLVVIFWLLICALIGLGVHALLHAFGV